MMPPQQILHQTGALIVEENGVEHYWENKSGTDVKLLSFDIFTPLRLKKTKASECIQTQMILHIPICWNTDLIIEL